MTTWTDKTIEKAIRDAKSAGVDIWLTDADKARGVGRLRLRAHASGRAAFYFRYSDSQGKQVQIPLGIYDRDGKEGLTLKEAGKEFGRLSKIYQGGCKDVRGYLEQQHAEKQAQIEASKRQREEEERQAKSGSLKALCDAYVTHLERQGKQSTADVRGIFHRNIAIAFPDLAAKRAADLTRQDVSRVLARLIDDGKGRAAAKTRSYLAAAFTAALHADSNPKIPLALHGFNLVTNPAALVAPLTEYNCTRERNLSEKEVRAFLKALKDKPGLLADTVWLSLYLAGQRFAQLLRVTPAKVDLDERIITLYDGKGNRSQPRVHYLPLVEPAAEIVKRLMALNGGKPFLITSTGKVPLRVETLSKFVAGISVDMVEAGTATEPFQLSDLRRTCETLLAKLGVSKEVRGRLLSHGISGVQDRNYNRYEYMSEKWHALEKWATKLEEITSDKELSNVVPLVQEA